VGASSASTPAATNPQILGAVRFDLFTASGEGGDALFIHRGPRSQRWEQKIGWTIPEIVF
jgi:hypothetical protein